MSAKVLYIYIYILYFNNVAKVYKHISIKTKPWYNLPDNKKGN